MGEKNKDGVFFFYWRKICFYCTRIMDLSSLRRLSNAIMLSETLRVWHIGDIVSLYSEDLECPGFVVSLGYTFFVFA